MPDTQKRRRNLHGRRIGRRLSQERIDLLENELPKLRPALKDSLQQISSLFDQDFSEYWFEIGFGDGDMLSELMLTHTDVGFIGCEPFLNGISSLLLKTQGQNTHNLKIWDDDALLLLNNLSEHQLDRLYVLNPDPWHKKRHHKRRIISQANLDIFARVLKPGALLYLTTDVPELGEWMLRHTLDHPAFIWKANTKDSWEVPPAHWVQTAYERKKARGSDKMRYFVFERR